MIRRHRLHPFPSFIALVCLSLSGAAQKSDIAIQADLEFAKGLAEEWQFVGLAEEVLRGIEAQGVSPRRAEELALLKCDIFRSAAVNERDRQRRNQLFDRALGAYTDFVERHTLSEKRREAELGLVRTAELYARSIEISLQEAVGDAARDLLDRRQKVLTEAVSRTADLVANLKATPERSEAQKRELAELMLTRARMLFDLGRTQEDGTFSFEQSISLATELVFIVGEGTPTALRAFDLIGRVLAAQQQWEEAYFYFEAVVETAIPADPKDWQELVRSESLDQSAKEQRWLFLELSSADLAEALANVGNIDAATRYALHFYNTQRREGFSFSPSIGYPALLNIARILIDTGGWIGGNIATGDTRWYATEEEARADHARRNVLSTHELALRIARQVKDDNKGNILQLRAQKLISEIASLPGVVVEPELLFEAAQGEYHDGNFAGAIESFQHLLSDIADKDAATRTFFGGRICWWIGRTFQRMDRALEAAMAFREGVLSWQGDPEFDAQNASSFYRAIEQVRLTDREAPVYVALFREAENLNTRFGTANKDEILWTQAERERTSRNYDAAIEKYKEIEAGADVYERALVGIAESQLRKGEIEEAERLFTEYVEEYVTDPRRSVADSPRRQANRRLAMAKAEFFRAFIAHGRAAASPTSPELWQRVLELTEGYHERHPQQNVLAPWCLAMALEAHLALRDIDAARRTFALLEELFPDDARVAASAVRFYRALNERMSEAEAAGEKDRAREIELEMALLLEKSNRLTSTPSFSNLRAESRHWMNLGEFEKAEPILRRLISRFGQEGGTEGEQIRRFVLPDLGMALLAMHRLGEARQFLEPLVQDESNPPSRELVIAYCRSLLGWIQPENGRMKIVPGAAETPKDLQGAIDFLAKLDKSPDAWTCEWYAYKFMIAYAYHVWATADGGPRDSDRLGSLRNQLTQITVELTTSFDHVGEQCAEVDAAAFEAIHGPGDLRAKFRWLQDKAR